MSKWGKHIAAIAVFLVLTVIYFSPAVFEGKVVRQGDTEKAIGMGNSQMDEYEKTAQPGEFSAWSDAMFGGMPYVSGYGNPAPRFPGYLLVEKPLKALGYMDAGMVFTGFVCFYILMCVMGVNWWLAIAGAIAFALASYNLIIIEAGHVTKAYVIAYMPLTLAGMALLFKRKYLWGAVVFLLGVAFSIANTHLQITYYLLLLCFFVYLGYLFNKLKEKAYKVLAMVGLDSRINDNFQTLSEGQKQLALLARTFVAKRKLLLLDEPESALDFRLRYQIMNLLCSYVERNHAVSLVTLHDSSLALNYCNTLLVLSESKLIGEVYPDKTPIEEMEMLLSKVYGTISIRELRNRQGKRQLVMMKEDDMH